jgi:ferritin-like protein
MISERQIELINKIASKDTFKYTGEIISGVDIKADIDYKFKITGHRKMMSVGEYYDYLLLKVVITGVHDRISKILFNPVPTEEGKIIAKSFENQLYKFYSDLNRDIQDYLRYFNDSG